MRKFLLQIKAVPGVKGCAVLDLGRREMHPLLPATASGEFATRLAERLARLADQLQPGEQLEFRFDKQACLVRRLVRGVLYVQGKAGFDLDSLQLTVKATSSAIDRTLKSAGMQRNLSYDFTNPDYINAVLTAFELCAEHFKSHLGHTLVAKKMQRAKENVSSLFPVVNDLIVDQNGRVYLRKGTALKLDSGANEAFARWLAGFISLVSASKPELAKVDLREITRPVAGPLEEANFYGVFKAI